MNKITRRNFLKTIGSASAAVVCGVTVFKPKSAFSLDAPQKAVDENSVKSKSFGYYADATKVDITKYPKKAGADGATQDCSNCQLLVKSGIELDGKTEKYGICSLFTADGVVAEKGWCNMWVKKV